MSKEEISRILLKHKAVSLSLDPPFTWASGIKSPIYCDNRLIFSYPESRKVIIEEFKNLLKDIEFDVVAGTASSGIPWASWLAEAFDVPLVYVRKEAKTYGRNQKIEGTMAEGARAVVVEDLISTGGSVINAAQSVRESGGVVTDCVAIFTYALERATRNAKDAELIFHTLDDFPSLIKVAFEENYLSGDDYEKIKNWAKDPEGWYYTYFM